MHTTYFEGVSTPPEGSQYTAEQLDELAEQYDAQQRQGYCERQEKRYSRMSKYSLDPDNQRTYAARAQEWGEKAGEYEKLAGSFNTVSEESKPKNENAATTVDNSIINSSEYRKTFDEFGELPKVTRSIFQRVREMLTHRTGSEYEDLSFVDSVTGKFLTRSDYDVKKQCLPSKAMQRMIKAADPFTIVGIHNHPNSSVPSMDDIEQVWKRKQKYGIVACHNGNLFKYSVLGEYDNNEVDFLLDRLNHEIYNNNRQQQRITSIIDELKNHNVDMEVFLWG